MKLTKSELGLVPGAGDAKGTYKSVVSWESPKNFSVERALEMGTTRHRCGETLKQSDLAGASWGVVGSELWWLGRAMQLGNGNHWS